MNISSSSSVDKRKKLEGPSCNLVLDNLHENCIHNILGLLPLESLLTSKLVCKSWHGIVTSAYFRNKHLRRRLGLDTRGIIFSAPVENYYPPPKKVFSVESNSTITDRHSSFHIKFMEFGGKTSREREYHASFGGRIVASCDGLVLLEEHLRATRLVLFNPVTKEAEDIPWGTVSSVPGCNLYALGHASSDARYYKILHLFMKDEVRSLGCEIMDVVGGSGSWREVDVPPTERFKTLHSPIFAMGALHWMQDVYGHGECVVTMPLEEDDGKFKTTEIPNEAKAGHPFPPFNTVFEMGEFLGFSSRGEGNQIQVWKMRGGEERDYYWEKQYDINGRGVGYLTPILYCEDGDKLVLKCGGDKCFYTYGCHSGDLKQDERVNKWSADYGYIFPHVNSLVSWRTSGR